MSRRVKGTLFVDYIRMIKSRKDVDWGKYLTEEDMEYLEKDKRILPSSWYPFDTFERMGIGVFTEIGGGDMDMVRLWGQVSTELLTGVYKNLVEPGNPVRSAEKFDIIRASFFDFPGVELSIVGEEKRLTLAVFFSDNMDAAEAQAYQALGGIERLLEMAGAKDIKYNFVARIWEGDPRTLIEVSWS